MCACGSRGMLLDEGLEAVLRPGAIVLHSIASAALDPIDGGKALHVELAAWDIVGSGIHLGNHHLVIVLEGSANLGVDGGQALAVSAPWGIEFDHDVLAAEHNLIKLLGNNNRDVILLSLGRDLLRLDGLLNGASLEVSDKLWKSADLSVEQVPLAIVVVGKVHRELGVLHTEVGFNTIKQLHALVGIHEDEVGVLLRLGHELVHHGGVGLVSS
mmetsp:Transcript_13096/g.36841  ORF Transcript_13096/g.36841 Transcript_13096/m.36841 type:complete len:214 (+) Transcript_13096:233-874(+)